MVVADNQPLDPVLRRQHPKEVEGREHGHLAGKVEKNHAVDTRLPQQRLAFVGRSEQAKRHLGVQHLLRMRAKRNHGRCQLTCNCFGLDPGNHGPVTAVHAVEYAQCSKKRLVRYYVGRLAGHGQELKKSIMPQSGVTR